MDQSGLPGFGVGEDGLARMPGAGTAAFSSAALGPRAYIQRERTPCVSLGIVLWFCWKLLNRDC
jgi:hypothetical protein